jgi:hypothetical protein
MWKGVWYDRVGGCDKSGRNRKGSVGQEIEIAIEIEIEIECESAKEREVVCTCW